MTLTPDVPDVPSARASDDAAPSARATVAGIALLTLFLGGLLHYKWTGSARAIAAAWSSAAWPTSADRLTGAAPGVSILYYFSRIWVALVYGLLIGAAVRAFVSPRHLARLMARGGTIRRQLVAAGAGTPLMLCSCCVTPVFTGVYERGARLASALTVMLASPALNPAALILTFILFPARVATARLVGAVVAVLLLPQIVERTAGTDRVVRPASSGMGRVDDAGDLPGGFLERFARSFCRISAVTIPLIVLGVLGSALVLRANASFRPANTVLGVAIVSAVALVMTLPTFFEIPIALVALSAGGPGLAAAILFAGPIVNLPSLLIVGREVRPRAALVLAAGVWVVAFGAGLATLGV